MYKELIDVKLPKVGILYIGFNSEHIYGYTAKEMQEYAYAAVIQERERCAAICDAETNPTGYEQVSTYNSGCFNTAEYLADVIRNRGENK